MFNFQYGNLRAWWSLNYFVDNEFGLFLLYFVLCGKWCYFEWIHFIFNDKITMPHSDFLIDNLYELVIIFCRCDFINHAALFACTSAFRIYVRKYITRCWVYTLAILRFFSLYHVTVKILKFYQLQRVFFTLTLLSKIGSTKEWFLLFLI